MKHYDEGWNDYVKGLPFDETQRNNIHYRDGYEDAEDFGATEEI